MRRRKPSKQALTTLRVNGVDAILVPAAKLSGDYLPLEPLAKWLRGKKLLPFASQSVACAVVSGIRMAIATCDFFVAYEKGDDILLLPVGRTDEKSGILFQWR